MRIVIEATEKECATLALIATYGCLCMTNPDGSISPEVIAFTDKIVNACENALK